MSLEISEETTFLLDMTNEQQLGPESLTDPEFVTACAVNWICGAGWTIGGGKASGAAATTNLSESGPLTLTNTYRVKLVMSGYVGGTVQVRCGSTGFQVGTWSGDGTHTQDIVCAGNTDFIIDGSAAFTGDIESVSVKEIL